MFDTEFLFDGDTVKKTKLSIQELKVFKQMDEVSIGGERYTITLFRYSLDDKEVEIWLDEVEE